MSDFIYSRTTTFFLLLLSSILSLVINVPLQQEDSNANDAATVGSLIEAALLSSSSSSAAAATSTPSSIIKSHKSVNSNNDGADFPSEDICKHLAAVLSARSYGCCQGLIYADSEGRTYCKDGIIHDMHTDGPLNVSQVVLPVVTVAGLIEEILMQLAKSRNDSARIASMTPKSLATVIGTLLTSPRIGPIFESIVLHHLEQQLPLLPIMPVIDIPNAPDNNYNQHSFGPNHFIINNNDNNNNNNNNNQFTYHPPQQFRPPNRPTFPQMPQFAPPPSASANGQQFRPSQPVPYEMYPVMPGGGGSPHTVQQPMIWRQLPTYQPVQQTPDPSDPEEDAAIAALLTPTRPVSHPPAPSKPAYKPPPPPPVVTNFNVNKEEDEQPYQFQIQFQPPSLFDSANAPSPPSNSANNNNNNFQKVQAVRPPSQQSGYQTQVREFHQPPSPVTIEVQPILQRLEFLPVNQSPPFVLYKAPPPPQQMPQQHQQSASSSIANAAGAAVQGVHLMPPIFLRPANQQMQPLLHQPSRQLHLRPVAQPKPSYPNQHFRVLMHVHQPPPPPPRKEFFLPASQVVQYGPLFGRPNNLMFIPPLPMIQAGKLIDAENDPMQSPARGQMPSFLTFQVANKQNFTTNNNVNNNNNKPPVITIGENSHNSHHHHHHQNDNKNQTKNYVYLRGKIPFRIVIEKGSKEGNSAPAKEDCSRNNRDDAAERKKKEIHITIHRHTNSGDNEQ